MTGWVLLQVKISMTVQPRLGKHTSVLGTRRQNAMMRKQRLVTYPILALFMLVHHVWGLSSACHCSITTVNIVPQPMPGAGETHVQPALEVMFKAMEKLLQQTAGQSVLLPRQSTSSLLLMHMPSFSSGYGLSAAAGTVCCFKATLLPPNSYSPKVKKWLSGELPPQPLSASRVMHGLQTTMLIALVTVLAVGMLLSYTRPDADGLFHSTAALLYLLYCMDVFLGKPQLDMALVAIVLLPQFGAAAVMQLAAVVAPLLLVALYAVWAVAYRVSALVLLLRGLWLMLPMAVMALLTIAVMVYCITVSRQACYLFGVMFSLLFMAMFSGIVVAEVSGVLHYISANTTELLYKFMQLCLKCAPVWVALAKPLSYLSVLRFVGLPTLQFLQDSLFSEETFPVQRLVSIVRVYTSMGLLLVCCSEHMAHCLLLLLLLKGGIEPNPGPVMNILAICAMMALSPRPGNSLDLAGRVVSAYLPLFVGLSTCFFAVYRCCRPDGQQ